MSEDRRTVPEGVTAETEEIAAVGGGGHDGPAEICLYAVKAVLDATLGL